MRYPLKKSDCRVDVFRGSGPGGQHRNKTSTAIRITHEPTGIVVECCNERSQHQNKETGFSILQGRLDSMLEDRRQQAKQESYDAKPSAGFSAQIRTCRMAGNCQVVTDHRTGVVHANPKAYLKGDIDGFLLAYLRQV